jgi:hypothetical protein
MTAALRRLLRLLVLCPVLVCAAATPAQAIARSCAWTVQITGDQVNALYPDEAAKYWIAIVPLPAGGRAVLHGRFPHARYTSINTYTTQTQAIDAIHDAQVTPDPGSSNPFTFGANRRAAARAYTVAVVKGQIPAQGRAPNTIYTKNADGSKEGTNAAIALRIYRPDRGLDIDGGVPLPSVTTYAPDGTRLVSYPDCPDTSLPDIGLTPTLANAGLGAGVTGGPSVFAQNPPAWHRYINTQTALADMVTDNQVTGPAVRPPLVGITSTAFPSGGFGENIDNKYVYATFSRELGAVLVLRGRLPTFPRTYAGQPRMGRGQLRYWSLCTENQATQYYACATDDQVPVDAAREFTIMVSATANRPANATIGCGVAWLPAGPAPQATMLLRNMLPAPSFAQAIQRVQPGREAEQMGAYYPRGTYYPTPIAAERAVGCAGAPVRRGR